MFRVSYRNMGSYEALALNHTVNAAVNPSFRAGVRYYELRKTTPSAAWVVNEQATMAGGGGRHAASLDGRHRAQQCGQSSGWIFGVQLDNLHVRFCMRDDSRQIPAGSLAQGEATMVSGAGNQTSSTGRWVTTSDMSVDPVDDCTFWYTQEYYSATSSSFWNTRIGSFTFGPCPAIQKGVLTGTVTNSVTATQ
jgi:hypothetical protein